MLNTAEMVKLLSSNPNLKFKTTKGGKEVVATYNQNGGISVGRSTLSMSGEIFKAQWQLILNRHTFIKAVNSGKKIKHESWAKFKPVSESLYDLLDYPTEKVIEFINGNWNIEEV